MWNGETMPRYDKLLTRKCSECGNEYNIRVDADDYWSWQHGVVIQKCFPYLDAGQRELLISGICGECYDLVFAVGEQ